MVQADAVEQFGLGLTVPVEQMHQQQFLAGVQVHLAQHGGGVTAVGAGELEDRVTHSAVTGRSGDLRYRNVHRSVP
ncbi:hypothetical protein Axi01nite_87870 [Actinoplanes xinjiangensis]|nr:hypothetical protein Axi01nite_87870 [Actinoplanes xinjiangensis]